MSISTGSIAQTELKIYSSTSAKQALLEIVPLFEKTAGRKVDIVYAGGSVLNKQIPAGTKGDLYIGPMEFSEKLSAGGWLAADSCAVFAKSRVGFVVAENARLPDITTVEKLKAVLLGASKVSYSAGASGVKFLEALEKLGIAEQVKAKAVPTEPGELVGSVVARGSAEIGMQQVSELLPVPGIQIIQEIPEEVQQTIPYCVTGFTRAAKHPDEQSFIDFLRSDRSRQILRDKGLEPALSN